MNSGNDRPENPFQDIALKSSKSKSSPNSRVAAARERRARIALKFSGALLSSEIPIGRMILPLPSTMVATERQYLGRVIALDDTQIGLFCKRHQNKLPPGGFDKIWKNVIIAFVDSAASTKHSRKDGAAAQEFLQYFPEDSPVQPGPLRAALELRWLWPGDWRKTDFARIHRNSVSLWHVIEEVAGAIGWAAMNKDETTEIYKALCDIAGYARRSTLPWHVLAPVRKLPWWNVHVQLNWDNDERPALVRVGPSYSAEEAGKSAAWIELITTGRELVHSACRHFNEALKDRESVPLFDLNSVAHAAHKLGELLGFLDNEKAFADSLTSSGKYPVQMRDIAVELVKNINAVVPPPPRHDKSKPGVYRGVVLDPACALLRAIYGMNLDAAALKFMVEKALSRGL